MQLVLRNGQVIPRRDHDKHYLQSLSRARPSRRRQWCPMLHVPRIRKTRLQDSHRHLTKPKPAHRKLKSTPPVLPGLFNAPTPQTSRQHFRNLGHTGFHAIAHCAHDLAAALALHLHIICSQKQAHSLLMPAVWARHRDTALNVNWLGHCSTYPARVLHQPRSSRSR